MCRIKDLSKPYKISSSKNVVSELRKIGINIEDLNNHNIYIKVTDARVEDLPKQNILHIKSRTFSILDIIDLDKYIVFDIYNLDGYSHAIISKDSIYNVTFATLNHSDRNRSSSDRELVFIYILAKRYNLNVYNGNNWERFDYVWDSIIESYFEQFPRHKEKIHEQIDLLSKAYDISKYNYIVKDYRGLSINKTARDLFSKTYTDNGYTFVYDKWCPADIWLFSDNYFANIHNKYIFNTLSDYNTFIKECIVNKIDLLPISLKMNMEHTILETVNITPYNYSYEYINTVFAKYPSMSTYINYTYRNNDTGKESLGKIEIRNFKAMYSLIGAELKGSAYHQDGKLTAMLFPLFGQEFKDKQVFIKNNNNRTILDNIQYIGLNKYNSLFIETLGYIDDHMCNTILQSILLIDYLESHPMGVNYCIEEMVRFGRSMSLVSAGHIILK